jgi:SAM-dependent methyltransferase
MAGSDSAFTNGEDLARRLRSLLDHFQIDRAHLVLHHFEADCERMAASLADRIAGFGFISHLPNAAYDALAPLLPRTIGITGGRSPMIVASLQRHLPQGRSIVLEDYALAPWSDLAVDRPAELVDAVRQLRDAGADVPATEIRPAAASGEIAGLRYRVAGSGPALALLPLALARSQWEPVLPALQQNFCTIVVEGPRVGPVGVLEARARDGYRRIVKSLFDELEVQSGQQVLEVGCGSGALVRLLAALTHRAARITAVDVNPYLLREARLLAEQEGLGGLIAFQEGDALTLPFPDPAFDVSYSATVMEEGDADRMLAELIRVTRPGGRIGAIVRAVDMAPWINVPLPPALRAKVSQPGGPVTPGGCADATLYDRFVRAGLHEVRMFPQLAFDQRDNPGSVLYRAPDLTPSELEELQDAVKQAVSAGTFFVARPHHAAVGIKPA